jgi:hypothetical protein
MQGQQVFLVSVVIKEENRDSAKQSLQQRLNEWYHEYDADSFKTMPSGSVLFYSISERNEEECEKLLGTEDLPRDTESGTKEVKIKNDLDINWDRQECDNCHTSGLDMTTIKTYDRSEGDNHAISDEKCACGKEYVLHRTLAEDEPIEWYIFTKEEQAYIDRMATI